MCTYKQTNKNVVFLGFLVFYKDVEQEGETGPVRHRIGTSGRRRI
jgi:hypothetical protein